MRLKREVRQHLQGATLLVLSYICHKTGADGAALFALVFGLVMVFGECDE